jgi:hypothetical protein
MIMTMAVSIIMAMVVVMVAALAIATPRAGSIAAGRSFRNPVARSAAAASADFGIAARNGGVALRDQIARMAHDA